MKVFPLFLVLLLCSCASPKSDDYTKFESNSVPSDKMTEIVSVKLNVNSPIDVRGIYESDTSVQTANILYDGSAGAGGMLAQVLTHAVITSNMQSKKLADQQISANLILTPLREVLDTFNNDVLVRENAKYVFTVDCDKEYCLESRPIFFLAQDGKTLSVKNVVKLYKENSEDVLYSNLVEVVAKPFGESFDELNQKNGEILKGYLSRLYEESLLLVASDVRGTYKSESVRHGNHRFYHGSKLRFERGETLQSELDKPVMRNLRGWLIAYYDNYNAETMASKDGIAPM